MPKCIRLKRKHRIICIGDLNELITLQDRVLTPGNIDATEEFTESGVVYSKIDTIAGETVFDENNIGTDVTHHYTIRFIAGITAVKTWILFDNRRFDILTIQDLEERHEWLILRCADRGISTNPVSEA